MKIRFYLFCLLLLCFFLNNSVSIAQNEESAAFGEWTVVGQTTQNFSSDTLALDTAFQQAGRARLQLFYPASQGDGGCNFGAIVIVIDNFKGAKSYTLGQGKAYWCKGGTRVLIDPKTQGEIVFDKYDAKKFVYQGRFNFKGMQILNDGTEAYYNVSGSFMKGKFISITVSPGESLPLKNDSTGVFELLVRNNVDKVMEGADIYVTDSLKSPGKEVLLGKTSKDGIIKYSVTVPKDAKVGKYKISFKAVKEGYPDPALKNCYIDVIINPLCIYSYFGSTPVFSFCTDNKEGWKQVEESETEIETSGTIEINSLLQFKGTCKIDTTTWSFSGTGDIIFPGIQLPGGYTVGDYTIAAGEFDIKLLGEKGALTGLLNKALKKLPKIGGIELKVKDLKFIGGINPVGIELTTNVKIGGLSTCTKWGNKDLEIDFDGIQILKNEPYFNLTGIAIKNAGVAPGFCLNNLKISYVIPKDSFDFDLEIEMPFMKASGGFTLVQGALDAIRLSAESTELIIPIASTGIGIVGLAGEVNHIIHPPMGVKFGGIFEAVPTKRTCHVKVLGVWDHDGTIGFEGEGTFFDVGINDDTELWLMKVSESEIKLNYGKKTFNLKSTMELGTKDGEDYLIKGEGKFSCNLIEKKYQGTLKGEIDVPELGAWWPADWLSKKVGLPLKGSGEFNFNYTDIDDGAKTVDGKAELMIPDSYLGKGVKFKLDLAKKWYQKGFFTLTEYTKLGVEGGGGDDEEEGINIKKDRNPVYSNKIILEVPDKNDTLNIIDNTDLLIVRINSPEKVPVTFFTKPDGTKITETNSEKTIEFDELDSGRIAYWTLKNPEIGQWIFTTQNPKIEDTVVIYYKNPKEIDFTLNVVQNGKTINITWDTNGMKNTHHVEIYLDEDKADYDGVFVISVPATEGKAEITLSDSLPKCSYNLFGRYSMPKYSKLVYSDLNISNPKASLLAPQNISAVYNASNGQITVTWLQTPDDNVWGYYLIVRDKSGIDSLYSILYSNETSITLDIQDYGNKTIYMTSYDGEGQIGCPSAPVQIITDVPEFYGVNNYSCLMIEPNPVNEISIIRYNLLESNFVSLKIFDIYGIEVLNILDNEFKTQGEYKVTINTMPLSTGMYICQFNYGNEYKTEKVIIVH